jgi:hypothetical protein
MGFLFATRGPQHVTGTMSNLYSKKKQKGTSHFLLYRLIFCLGMQAVSPFYFRVDIIFSMIAGVDYCCAILHVFNSLAKHEFGY